MAQTTRWRRGRVILNPAAGGGACAAAVRALASLRPWLSVVESTSGGHASRLAAEALEDGCDLIVAAGGDGAVSRVAHGMAGSFDAAALGVLPCGTANDFARAMGIGVDLPEAFALLDAGPTQPTDLIRVTTDAAPDEAEHFVNMATGGFSVELGRRMDATAKKRWGRLAYLIASLQCLADHPQYRVRIEGDGERLELTTPAVLVANGRWAGGMPLMPEADEADALLDVAMLRVEGLADAAALFASFLTQSHLENERLEFRRWRRVRVEADPPMRFHADGEEAAATPVTFEVMPHALQVVRPASASSTRSNQRARGGAV